MRPLCGDQREILTEGYYPGMGSPANQRGTSMNHDSSHIALELIRRRLYRKVEGLLSQQNAKAVTPARER